MYQNDSTTHKIGRKAQEIRTEVNTCEGVDVIGITVVVKFGLGCQEDAISKLQENGWKIAQIDATYERNCVNVHIRPE